MTGNGGKVAATEPDLSSSRLADEHSTQASLPGSEAAKVTARDTDLSSDIESPADTSATSSSSHGDAGDRLLFVEASNGTSFVVRWSECDTWEKFKVVLEEGLCSEDESSRKRIREGSFVVNNDSWDLPVSPQYWKNVLDPKPPVRLGVNLQRSPRTGPGPHPALDSNQKQLLGSVSDPINSSHSDPKSPAKLTPGIGDHKGTSEIEEPAPVNYERKIKYTVDYYRKDQNGWDPDYLYSYSADDPLIQSLWKIPTSAPVLEEKHTVLYPRNRVISRQNLRSSRPDAFDPSIVHYGQPDDPDKLETGDKVGLPSVQIHSPLLLNALGAVAAYWSTPPKPEHSDRHHRDDPAESGDNLRGGIFSYPFKDLYYYKKELIEYKNGKYACCAQHSEAYQQECGEHIDLLLEYLYAQPDIGLAKAEERWAHQIPTTNFASFWLLMKPGVDVYVRKKGVLNAFVVDSVRGGIEFSGRGKVLRGYPYTVSVWGMWFDGNVISRIGMTVTVPVFDSEREITSLPVFPVEFQDAIDHGATRERLVKRGRKFFKCCKGPAYMEYTGVGYAGRTSKHIRARVVIDHFDKPWTDLSHSLGHDCEFEDGNGKHDRSDVDIPWHLTRDKPPKPGAGARSPRCECPHCVSSVEGGASYPPETHSSYDNIIPSEIDELTEHQYLLCWNQMFGFILKDRNYDLLDVEHLVEPRLSDDAIESLVLRPESNKDAIKALVKTYTDQANQNNLFSADFIQNKGEGQVILLHGPPGTGKTLTAESVAEFTRKPLVSITAADLGHEPQDLERNLTRFLKNAHIWGAVVLLDEADIYLQRRSNQDLKRNSIVSIFLRLLDYFQGILFLTSNRVGQIDEAFMSRIHIALGYRPLDDEARAHIWDALFRKIQDDYKRGGTHIEYEYDAKQYVKRSSELRALDWNGREIRNAFQTVVALAMSDAKKAAEKRGGRPEDVVPEIRESHFQHVVAMSAAFRSYMTSTHEGMEDRDHAFRLGNRDDRFYQVSES